MLRSTSLLLLAVIGLAACNKNEPAPAPVAATPATAQPAPATASAGPSASAVTIGADVALPINAQQRTAREATSKDGRAQRRAVYEFLDGDVASVSEAVRKAMLDAGYKASDAKPEGQGMRSNFRRKNTGSVTVLVRPLDDEKPRNPGAKGLVYASWYLEPDAKAAAGSAAAPTTDAGSPQP